MKKLLLGLSLLLALPTYAARTDVGFYPAFGGIDFNAAGVKYVVHANNGSWYIVWVDSAADVSFSKSSDGISWSFPTTVYTGTVVTVAVWYDRWSNIGTDLIHVVYTESATDDTLYRSIDTGSSDTLGTQTTVFDGASTAGTPPLSITRARGGNLYVYSDIDGGTEGGFFRSTDTGGTWGSRTVPETIAGDGVILLPGWAADNQDAMAIYWDVSANGIDRYVYDDSGNSWAATSIFADGSMAELFTTAWPPFSATVDIANSRNMTCAWSATDSANADLRCAYLTESAITEVTNAVLNSTDDQGLVGLSLATDTGYWHAFYVGKSDGSETFSTSVNIYTKVSTDNGTNWGSETLLTAASTQRQLLVVPARFTGDPVILYYVNMTEDFLHINAEMPAAGGGLAANPIHGFAH